MNQPSDKLKVYVLCRYALESSLYTSWIGESPYQVEIVQECAPDWNPPDDCGVVVTHEHYRWEEISALRRIYEQNRFPTLILADGVLEYRNTWLNPGIPDGSMYQPLMAHKIACIGHNSARMIDSWGNSGKTEVVGIPRMDHLLGQQTELRSQGPFRLLVATATTPAFTPKQRRCVIESLVAVKQYLEKTPTIQDRAVEVVWRLTDGLETEIGLTAAEEDMESLSDAIESSDAVITTPSTIYLESALQGRPTAILDFNNSPQFIPGSWTITAPEHLDIVLSELVNPPAAKLWFQNFVLNDNLSICSPAAPRLIELISKMVELGWRQRTQHEPLSMPANILRDPAATPKNLLSADTSTLFPSNEAFSRQEVQRLQAELSQATHRLGVVPQELNDKNIQISQLQAALDESKRRVADVRVRLFKLRKILGIGKENQD